MCIDYCSKVISTIVSKGFFVVHKLTNGYKLVKFYDNSVNNLIRLAIYIQENANNIYFDRC